MSMNIRPIRPTETKNEIPDFVIEAVNELIQENMDSCQYATILQKTIKERILTKTDQDFKFSWLDFEQLYRAEGWSVEYDKPGYNESYEAYFKFSPLRFT